MVTNNLPHMARNAHITQLSTQLLPILFSDSAMKQQHLKFLAVNGSTFIRPGAHKIAKTGFYFLKS